MNTKYVNTCLNKRIYLHLNSYISDPTKPVITYWTRIDVHKPGYNYYFTKINQQTNVKDTYRLYK